MTRKIAPKVRNCVSAAIGLAPEDVDRMLALHDAGIAKKLSPVDAAKEAAQRLIQEIEQEARELRMLVQPLLESSRIDQQLQARESTKPDVEPSPAKAPEAAPEAKPAPGLASKGAIEDFGEALPPGRRGFVAALSETLSDSEISSMPLREIWPASDVDAIEDKFVAAVAFAARQEIPSKPRVAHKLKRWAEAVNELRTLAADIASGQVTRAAFEARIPDSLRQWRGKVELLEAIEREQWKRIGKVEAYPNAYRYVDGKKEDLPYVTVEIDGRRKTFYDNEGTIAGALSQIQSELNQSKPAEQKLQFEVRNATREGIVFINKKGDPDRRRLMTFKTSKEAFEAIKEKYEALVEAWEQSKAVTNVTERDLRRSENRPRTGADHRNGKDATPKMFQDAFGFRGTEWGKWVSQGAGAKDRQGMLNDAYDALMDLSSLLGIPPRAVSLNGTLGIAFGSRGSGWASAHYEPSNLVINLTKTRGAGSLAHEWLHALDNHFAHKRGGEVKATRGMSAEVYRRENYITYKPEPLMVRKDGSRHFPPMTKEKLEQAFAERPYPSGPYAPDKWHIDPDHKAGVRPEVERSFAELVETLKASPMLQRAQTLDKGKSGYWSSIIEVAARSFESYLIAKMAKEGYHNDYLANVTAVEDFSRSRDRYPYLLESEIEPVEKAFDALFDTIETQTDERGNVAMFSRASKSSEELALAALAETDELFVYPKPTSKDVGEIANAINPAIRVEPQRKQGLQRVFKITMPDGAQATMTVRDPNSYGPSVYAYDLVDGEMHNVVTERPGENRDSLDGATDVWIDVSKLEEGGKGVEAYQIAEAFAHNNGYVFIGDPAGLSDQALRRRNEQMLSSALKWGTTAHLAPHPRQMRGSKDLGVPALKWEYGSHVANIRAMMDVSVRAFDHAFPSAAKIDFDVNTGQFIDTSVQEAISRGDVESRVDSLRYARDRDARKALAGGSTAARAAVLRAVLRQASATGAGSGRRGSGAGLLDQLVAQGAHPEARNLFYSHAGGVGGEKSSPNDLARAGLQLPGTATQNKPGKKAILAEGLPAETAAQVGQALKANGLGNIEFVRSDSLPTSQKKRLEAAGIQGARGVFFPDTGEKFVFIDRVKSVDEALFVALHEGFHHGLRETLGDGAVPVLREMWRTNQMLRARVAAVKRSIHGIDHDTAIEEALADLAGEGEATKLRGWDGLVKLIKAWLGKVARALHVEMQWSDEMIRQFVAGAAKRGLSSKDPVAVGATKASMPDLEAPGHQGDAQGADSGKSVVYQTMREAERDAPDGFLRLFHASPESGLKRIADDIGLFGGLFASGNTRGAVGTGRSDYKYYMDVAEEDVLTQRALDRTDEQTIDKALKKVMGGWAKTPDDLEIAREAVVNDKSQDVAEEDMLRVFRSQDFGEASWEAQRVRGALAKELGYKAVEMDDETGTSYLVLPGTDIHQIGVDPNESSAPDAPGAPVASRQIDYATMTDAALGRAKSLADMKVGMEYRIGNFFDKVGTLSFWNKSVGTPYHLAKRNPQTFGRFYEASQRFLGDVSAIATHAADLAPRILPKLEHWKDIRKQPISAADNKAIAAPIFEGTLIWTRDENGKPIKLDQAERKAKALTIEQKVQQMLRFNRVDERTVKMWQGDTPEVFAASVETRFKNEMLKPGIVWTKAEAQSIYGLTDGQFALYEEFRAATNKSLNDLAVTEMLRIAGEDASNVIDEVRAMNAVDASAFLRDHFSALVESDPERKDVLNDKGDKAIKIGNQIDILTKHGYAPLMRFGSHTLDVVSKDGERLYFGMFESPSEASKMADRMRKNFPEALISRGTQSKESFKLTAGLNPETIELFGSILGLDSTGNAESDKAFQSYLATATANRSALRRLIHRKGIDGFSEDAGRVLAGFITSNARRASGNLHFGEMASAVDEIPMGQGELKDYATKLNEYVRNPTEEAQALKGMLFTQYIGGSIASALVNMTQPMVVSFPYLSQYGGVAKSASRLTKAMKDLASRATLEDDLAEALKTAEEGGVVAPNEIFNLYAQAQGKGQLRSGDGTRAGDAAAKASNAFAKTMLAWGKAFSMAEVVNRRATFIAAYRTAKEQGIDNPAQFAEQAVVETQFQYNRGNRPAWARGAVGGTLFTFKTFGVSYLELMHRMAVHGGPEGRKAFLLAMGMMLLVGGADGLPFMEDAEDVADAFMQRVMGLNWSTKAKRKEFFAELLGQDAAGVLSNGISGLPGVPIDVSGRLGMGNMLPLTGLLRKDSNGVNEMTQAVGPVGDLAKRGLSAVGLAMQGDLGKAALEIAPKAASNVAKGFDMAATGAYRDAKGNKVIDVSVAEAVMKGIGFQPSSVAQVQESMGAVQRGIAINRATEREIVDEWARGVYNNDPGAVAAARERLREWNSDNPHSQIKISIAQVQSRVKNMRMSKAERLAKTAPKEVRSQVKRELELSQ